MRSLLLASLLASACTSPTGEDRFAAGEDTSTRALDTAEEAELLRLTNASRAAEGLAPLLPYWDLQDDARAQVARMMASGGLFHNADLASVTATTWTRLDENVGVGGSAASLQPAFMASPGHRANVLGAYDYVGVGADRGPSGRLWVAVVFMASPVVGLEAGLPPFRDDEGNTHEAAIGAIARAGITLGCNPPVNDRYCPHDPVTRAQMATFLTRALALPASSHDRFVDDDLHWAEANIQALAAAGITVGCNPPTADRFCPDDPVTRDQMASFLARALGL